MHNMSEKREEVLQSSEWDLENIISAVTYSVRFIVKLGQISFEEASLREVTIQPTKATTDYSKTVLIRDSSVMERRFQDLPINIQLLIFSYLDAKTLCRIASTCQYWCMLSEDEILWSRRLASDINKWKRLSHMTYPPTYLEANTELTPKQIYCRCHPSNESRDKPYNSVFTQVLDNLQSIPSLFSRRPLKVVMFGPGLESNTKMLTQKLLWDPKSPFKVTGMFPGQFEGVGSGVCLKHKDSNIQINFITLYGSTRAERENNAKQNKGRISKLLVENVDNRDEEEIHPAEVSHAVKELCKTVDAFIYVVDSSSECQKVKEGNKELHAMMNVSWTAPRVPLLVSSCAVMEHSPSHSCAEVTELLQVSKLSRPWMVNSVWVDSLEGFSSGFTWLVKQAKS